MKVNRKKTIHSLMVKLAALLKSNEYIYIEGSK